MSSRVLYYRSCVLFHKITRRVGAGLLMEWSQSLRAPTFSSESMLVAGWEITYPHPFFSAL